jgi:hypothetical protein
VSPRARGQDFRWLRSRCFRNSNHPGRNFLLVPPLLSSFSQRRLGSLPRTSVWGGVGGGVAEAVLRVLCRMEAGEACKAHSDLSGVVVDGRIAWGSHIRRSGPLLICTRRAWQIDSALASLGWRLGCDPTSAASAHPQDHNIEPALPTLFTQRVGLLGPPSANFLHASSNGGTCVRCSSGSRSSGTPKYEAPEAS